MTIVAALFATLALAQPRAAPKRFTIEDLRAAESARDAALARLSALEEKSAAAARALSEIDADLIAAGADATAREEAAYAAEEQLMILADETQAATLALTAAGVVLAKPGGGMGGDCGDGMGKMQHGQDHMKGGMKGGMGKMGEGDPAARMAQHLAKLKAELKITPAQADAWAAFEKQTTDQGAAMQAMRAKMQADMAERREAMSKQHEANMAAHKTAMATLAASLTPQQKALIEKHEARNEGRHGKGGHQH